MAKKDVTIIQAWFPAVQSQDVFDAYTDEISEWLSLRTPGALTKYRQDLSHYEITIRKIKE